MNEKNLELAVKLRHELHRNPELSNHETWTKRRLIDFLKTHTKLEIVDRGLWFYAVYRAGEGKRNIAFRADFDAIPMQESIDIPHASQNPGVSHKCGHDGHSAALAAFALEIDQLGADKNVFFLFQHAEETGDGAAQCAVFIKENGIHEIRVPQRERSPSTVGRRHRRDQPLRIQGDDYPHGRDTFPRKRA